MIYWLAFGDQPALICDLVDRARTCGFPVVAAGRGHQWLPHFCKRTPETVWGKLLPAATSLAIGGLPLGLAHGPRLIRPVKKVQSLCWSDARQDTSTRAFQWRRQMERDFAPELVTQPL